MDFIHIFGYKNIFLLCYNEKKIIDDEGKLNENDV